MRKRANLRMRCSALAALCLGLVVHWPVTGAELPTSAPCESSQSAGRRCPPHAIAQDDVVRIATFDSGFGGFFTAKSIEAAGRVLQQRYAARFSIDHYGDSLNAPYGDKTPEQIAGFAARGIFRAFQDGAQQVFIACNTASTQHKRITEILDTLQPGLSPRTVSIVDSSVAEMKRQIEERLQTRKTVRIAILATPATVLAETYPRALARAFGVDLSDPVSAAVAQTRWYRANGEQIRSAHYAAKLRLVDGNVVEIYQVAPANWVDMIEHEAAAADQDEAVASDLRALSSQWHSGIGNYAWDVVGEFCTHYPVFDPLIRKHALRLGLADAQTTYIKQAPLMAEIFEEMMKERLATRPRRRSLTAAETQWLDDFSRPRIFITGTNAAQTRKLARVLFPNDPAPQVNQLPAQADVVMHGQESMPARGADEISPRRPR